MIDEVRRYQGEGHTIDRLIPHQANLTRILIPACKSSGIDPSPLCASLTETRHFDYIDNRLTECGPEPQF